MGATTFAFASQLPGARATSTRSEGCLAIDGEAGSRSFYSFGPSTFNTGEVITLNARNFEARDAFFPPLVTYGFEPSELAGLYPYSSAFGTFSVTSDISGTGDWTFYFRSRDYFTNEAWPIGYDITCRIGQAVSTNLPSTVAAGSVTSFTVSATSGLPVTVESLTATCSVSDLELTASSPGPCQLRLSQAGDGDWLPVTRTVTVNVDRSSQSITFGALSGKTLGDADFLVTATASSGLAVSFASSTLLVCTVSGSSVRVVAVGTCTVTASQAGNATYSAATAVSQSFTAGYGIAQLAPPAKTTATRGSTIPVKFKLTTANGTPISATEAAAIRCPATSATAPSATVTLSGLAPVCATYDPASGFFQANVKTTGAANGELDLTVTVKAGSTVLATTTVKVTIVR